MCAVVVVVSGMVPLPPSESVQSIRKIRLRSGLRFLVVLQSVENRWFLIMAWCKVFD